MLIKTIKGVEIPSIGLGTVDLLGEAGVSAILSGIECGYRHIDTAIRYRNEGEVGDAIRLAGLPREEIFVTTKIWPPDLAAQTVHLRVEESLERLKLDYIDLLLIHWPSKDAPLGETLDAFSREKEAGRIRAIGVSNFTASLLDEAINVHKADLLTNQVEYHPFLAQPRVLSAVRDAGMSLTAYLPLAGGEVFRESTLQEIGAMYGKSAGQVALRWLVQQDSVLAIPRTSKIEHMKANLDIFDFGLDEAEMQRIDGLDRQYRRINLEWAPEWDVI